MTWFRNTDTGHEFELNGRFAAALVGRPGIVELDGEGGQPVSEPTPDLTEGELATVRKADLQAMAREAGVSDEGTKAELAERLRVAHGDHA